LAYTKNTHMNSYECRIYIYIYYIYYILYIYIIYYIYVFLEISDGEIYIMFIPKFTISIVIFVHEIALLNISC
jgi:hypothetical protein